ncbi:envelope glycoprotein K [Spheniscid alphaherpesvirus 1]|uniref:Envelope glycoprotein K n=1 Tax=Spheniscid alphaherpesvirus 1 TaxID=2560777 RepID=A0A1R3TE60_9ALPH|nr:envelope glycoprotein K [Spheniscid alphaherpesvirus 1]
MFLSMCKTHFVVLTIIGVYSIFMLWFATSGISPEHRCAYATTVPSMYFGSEVSKIKNISWGRYNESSIYVTTLKKKEPEDDMTVYVKDVKPTATHRFAVTNDHHCIDGFMDSSTIKLLNDTAEVRKRMLIVLGSKDCLSYLWKDHLGCLVTAWTLYTVFWCLRSQRRMFGVMRDRRELIHPSKYALNYTTRVMSCTLQKCRYTKMARFMCEMATHRDVLCTTFSEDPISFMFSKPLSGILILTELIIHTIAQCVVVKFVEVAQVPCSNVFPNYVSIVTWCVVATIAIIETVSLFCQSSSGQISRKIGQSAEDNTGTSNSNKGGIGAVFTNCCATIMSGIIMKTLHMAALVGLVILLLKYEQSLQARLLGY